MPSTKVLVALDERLHNGRTNLLRWRMSIHCKKWRKFLVLVLSQNFLERKISRDSIDEWESNRVFVCLLRMEEDWVTPLVIAMQIQMWFSYCAALR